MEIREFAERVLFSGSLEAKLAPPPAGMSDDEPGRAIGLPGAPGRPDGLGFARVGERARLPAFPELRDDEGRAVLLHAFANHELLATELMALALLRFPDAPAAFRRGLVRTLTDEQEHTRLYLERLAACGTAFGSLPVNGYFWRHISGMESPADYVSRLSLTFEQANLDYSRHYAEVFREAGDAETGRLLDRIHRDEIAHVGYGLKWFRRWKAPGTSDWDAWVGRIRFPLHPSRARGNAPFNADGRRRAGLDPGFIENLRLLPATSGRAPRVAVFNPAAEACAQADSPAAAADPALEALAADLDLLAVFLARPHDVAIVRREPSRAHLRRLAAAGIALPTIEAVPAGGPAAGGNALRDRQPAGLIPWGWSADSAALLRELLPDSDPPWDRDIRALYSKESAAELSRRLAGEGDGDPGVVPVAARTAGEVAAAVAGFAAGGFGRSVCKAPFGLAGRGMIRISADAGPTAADRAWIDRTLAAQHCVVVEPWLDRCADFSVQYALEPGRPPRCRGFVRLYNSESGRFLACAAGPSFGRLLPDGMARVLQETGAAALYRERIPTALAELPGLSRLPGNLGIDALVYRDPGGAQRLRPVVEINPRFTMGRVTLALRRLVHPSATVTLRIVTARQAAGVGSFAALAAALERDHPAVTAPSPAGPVLQRGVIPLNDPESASRFLAVAIVAGGPVPDPAALAARQSFPVAREGAGR